jgi:hypothetical protein
MGIKEQVQREINALSPEAFMKFVYGENMAADRSGLSDAESEAWYGRYPVLRRYDDAFRAVVREMRETKVGDTPAIWLVYNMGVIVKTRASLFSIDLCHRLAPTIADELDFAIITHNHLDHYTQKFYNEMNGRLHKTVVSNFLDNYGAFFHKGVGGFSRGERTYKFKDVVVRTCQSDHNEYLTGFTMPVEIDCGGFTIFHVGDTANVTELHPLHTPDLWIHHCRCWKRETGPGAAHLRPKLTVVAHLHEMQHPCGRARWTFADGDAAKEESEKAGVPAVVPFWGDRIA